MKHYSVIVVGAGPGGSTCAYALARKGVDVLLLERARLPRLKPCGGGFPEKTRALYDFDLSPVLEKTVREAVISIQGQRHIFIPGPEGMGYMVMRDKFDALVAQQAQAQGVEFHQEEECLSVEPEKNRWIVRTNKDTYSTEFLVGADGAPSRIAGQLGLMRSFDRYGVAIAAELRVSDEQLARQGPCVHFDFLQVPKGYAWIFPKADHLTVGMFSALPRVKGMRKALDEFIDQNANLRGYREMFFCRGHLMPRGGVYHRLVTEGALLVGDAAAMTDPFFGEGIYYAARSGILASNAIIRAMNENLRRLEHYDQECRQTLVKDFWWARFFNFGVYRFPGLSYPPFYHRPYLQNLVLDVVTGRISWQTCVLRMIFLSPYWAFKREKGQG
jgi:geranylgeranyl reductase family protein